MNTDEHPDSRPDAPDRAMQDRIAELEASQAQLLRAQELSRLQRDLAVALGATTDLDEGLRLCLDAACLAAGLDCGGIYLLDPLTGAVDLTCHHGLTQEFVELIGHLDADAPQTSLVRQGRPLYTRYDQLRIPIPDAELREGLRALAALPVHHQGRVIGCLNVASHSLVEVPPQARHALEAIAAQIGSAIARLQAQQAVQTLSSKLISAREDERRHLAAEIHDSVGQGLIAIQLAAQAALDQCPPSHPAGPRDHVAGIVRQCVDLIQEARRISQGLYPATLESLGLVAALRQLLQSIGNGPAIRLDIDPGLERRRFEPEVEIALFRIAQETLHNALRHSQATEILLTLAFEDGRAVLRVCDNGVGLAGRNQAKPGLGLVDMRERAQAVGATLNVSSSRGGTAVEVSVAG